MGFYGSCPRRRAADPEPTLKKGGWVDQEDRYMGIAIVPIQLGRYTMRRSIRRYP